MVLLLPKWNKRRGRQVEVAEPEGWYALESRAERLPIAGNVWVIGQPNLKTIKCQVLVSEPKANTIALI